VGVPGNEPPNPLTTVDLVERAASLGVKVLQIADNLPLHALTDLELEALEAYAAEHGVRIEVGTRGIDPDHLRAYLAFAERFGSEVLRIVIDMPDHEPPIPDIINTLKGVAGDFERAGIRLAIENHDRFKAAELVQIVESVGSDHVGICLDTTNSFGASEGPAVVVPTLAPYTVHLHIKDYVVFRSNANMGFIIEGRPVGEGVLDVAWLLDSLADRPIGSAILELWTPGGSDLAATIAREADWARRTVSGARKFFAECSP
jgi:sugar phosphate isomerase/epimerase